MVVSMVMKHTQRRHLMKHTQRRHLTASHRVLTLPHPSNTGSCLIPVTQGYLHASCLPRFTWSRGEGVRPVRTASSSQAWPQTYHRLPARISSRVHIVVCVCVCVCVCVFSTQVFYTHSQHVRMIVYKEVTTHMCPKKMGEKSANKPSVLLLVSKKIREAL